MFEINAATRLMAKPRVATARFFDDKPTMNHVVIEPATAEDLDELSDLLGEKQGETITRLAIDFRTAEPRARFCSPAGSFHCRDD